MADNLGQAAKKAFTEFAESLDVDTKVPSTTFDKQLTYLEKTYGAQAPATVGVTKATWKKWLTGKRRPNSASQKKVLTAYTNKKRSFLSKLRQTRAAKKRIKSVRIQISGTAQISDQARYRTNFCESDLVGIDLTAAWTIRKSPKKLAEFFTILIQDVTGVEAYWPEPDVTITLIG